MTGYSLPPVAISDILKEEIVEWNYLFFPYCCQNQLITDSEIIYKDVFLSRGSSDVESLNLFLKRNGSWTKQTAFGKSHGGIIYSFSTNLCFRVNHTQACAVKDFILSILFALPLSLSRSLASSLSVSFFCLWPATMEIRKNKNPICTVGSGHYSVCSMCICGCTIMTVYMWSNIREDLYILTKIVRWGTASKSENIWPISRFSKRI